MHSLSRTCFILATLALSLPVGASLPVDTIVALNPDLYVGRRSDGVTLVMERLESRDTGRFRFWEQFAKAESKKEPAYCQAWWDAPRTTRAVLPIGYRTGKQRLEIALGLSSFEIALKRFAPACECWVAYATPATITHAEDIRMDAIEMYVSVTTAKGAPMVVHMGINRGFQFLLNLAGNPSKASLKAHPNLALSLHSFAARVMLARDSSKQYMITNPLDKMREILDKALPGEVFEGTTWTRAEKIHERQQASTPSAEWVDLNQRIERARAELDQIQAQIRKQPRTYPERKDAPGLADGDQVAEQERRLDSLDEQERRLTHAWRSLTTTADAMERREIRDIASRLPLSPETSPIAHLLWPEAITIYDRSRKAVLFHWNRDTRTGEMGGVKHAGQDADRFEWFFHEHLLAWATPMTTINLDALAALSMPTHGKGGEEADKPGTEAKEERKESKGAP